MNATLPSFFGTTFVINLAERTDRRRLVELEFCKAGWTNFQFFPALRFDDPRGFKYPAWRGCFYSHLRCLRLAQEAKLESVLMIEDDITLSPSIVRLTPMIMQALNNLEWDFIYFGHEPTSNILRAKRKADKVSFEPCNSELLTTHFYGVKKRIIPRLIAHLERNARTIPHDGMYGPMPVDGAYNTFRRYNSDVVTYLANPKLGWQRPSRSDVTPTRLDNLLVLRPLLARAREIRHFLNRALDNF